MRKDEPAETEGMCVLIRRRPNGCTPDMCNHRMCVDPRRLLGEIISMIRGPGILFDRGHAIGKVRDAPTMQMVEALGIALALAHQIVLRAHQTAFDTGRLVGAERIKTAHRTLLY